MPLSIPPDRNRGRAGLAAILVLVFGTDAMSQSPPPTLAELTREFAAAEGAEAPKRPGIVRRIAALRTSESTSFLLAELERSEDYLVRTALLQGLAETKDKRVFERFKKIADTSASLQDRLTVIGLLPRFESESTDFLLHLGERDSNLAVRRAALVAVGRAKTPAVLRRLKALHEQGDPELRAGVVAAVAGNWPVEEIFPSLLAPHLGPKSDPAPRVEAMRVLARAADPRYPEFALALAADEARPPVLSEWLKGCAAFDTRTGLDAMVALFERSPGALLDEFLAATSALKAPPITEWFRTTGLKHAQQGVRIAALRHLGQRRTPEAIAAVSASLRSQDDKIVREGLAAIAGVKDERIQKLARELVGHKGPEIAAEALRALWATEPGSRASLDLCLKIAKDSRAWPLRMTALELLKHDHAEAAREVLFANCAHPTPQVRGEAYDALTRLRTKETVDFLLTRLPEEQGRGRYDLLDALVDLTGFDYGRNVKEWTSWWTRVRNDYPLPPKPKAKKRSAPAAGYATYYGIAVRSDRVAFVIDVSGSMAPTGTGISKLRQAQDNLIAVLETFGPDTKFTIIAFGSNFTSWSRTLVAATKDEKARAKAWVQNLRATGGTNVFDSMEAALAIPEVDTVFLLSDGAPSAGRVVATDEITRLLGDRNRFLRIRINTIGIAVAGATADFMRRLAAENFGEFSGR